MNSPSPFEIQGLDYFTLRRRWYGRYIPVETQFLQEVRRTLEAGATEAQKRINSLAKKDTFSAGVRTAQIRLAKNEARIVLKEIFGPHGIQPIFTQGHRQAAKTASEALTATDRAYLQAVFKSSAQVDAYIRSQEHSAILGVAHAISRITKSNQPLSSRVYKTRSLANRSIDTLLTTSIMRGDSAQDIAKSVRSSIRPDTPGGVSYAAMRLGRTELNNAFHATSIALSQDRPWIESMAWNLSATHENTLKDGKVEICEVYAARHWHVDQVPTKPHPQCRCFVTPVLEASETFQRHLLAGQYNDWIENAA